MSDDIERRLQELENDSAARFKTMMNLQAENYKKFDQLEKLAGEPVKAIEKEVADLKARVKELEAKVGKMKK
jgi:phage shock protein A